jgi:hypothetical protein
MLQERQEFSKQRFALSLCLLIGSLSRPRGRCGRLSRQNNGNEKTTAESKEEAKGGVGANSFSAVDFGPLD